MAWLRWSPANSRMACTEAIRRVTTANALLYSFNHDLMVRIPFFAMSLKIVMARSNECLPVNPFTLSK